MGPSGVAEARRLTGSNLVVGYKFLISALLLSVWISATLELRYLELYRRRGCNRCLAGKAREDGKSFFFFGSQVLVSVGWQVLVGGWQVLVGVVG